MVKRQKSPIPLRLLGSAWRAQAIWQLRDGARHLAELQAEMEAVSPKMLTACLRKLVREGVLLRRTKRTSPPTVLYSLTPVGEELSKALSNFVDIARRLKRP